MQEQVRPRVVVFDRADGFIAVPVDSGDGQGQVLAGSRVCESGQLQGQSLGALVEVVGLVDGHADRRLVTSEGNVLMERRRLGVAGGRRAGGDGEVHPETLKDRRA